MIHTRRLLTIIAVVSAAIFNSACSSEPGSPKWCADLQDKPPLKWSMSERETYEDTCLEREIDRAQKSMGLN